jgi:carbon-monoxide dehydrogenase small subunit
MIKYEEKSIIELDVNNEKHFVMVRPSDVLIDILREKLGLTGGKIGCKNGDCGTCTILMDDWPVKSCLVLAVEAVGHKIVTIEGLNNTELQKSFIEQCAFQCGYCTPGFLMVCQGLINHHPDADDTIIEEWLQSNICRCTSYSELRLAITKVLNKKS